MKKEMKFYNVLNNRAAKMVLAASLLLTGVSTTISPVGQSYGLIGEFLLINQAEASGVFAGGTGTVSDPYLLSTYEELNQVRNYSSSHFKMTNDINLSANNWTPIYDFSGVIDGQGYSITGMNIVVGAHASVGLFAKLSNANIKNLNVTDVTISSASTYSKLKGGIIAGEMLGGNLENVDVEGSILSDINTAGMFGGVVGSMDRRAVANNVYAEVDITGGYSVGGFASAIEGTISNSAAVGDVTGGYTAGGFVGGISNRGTISKSYAKGNVNGSDRAGGFIGNLYAAGNDIGAVNLSEVYATGNVVGRAAGGFVGMFSHGTIKNAYATGNVQGSNYTGGFLGRLDGGFISTAYASGEVTSIGSNLYVGGFAGLYYTLKQYGFSSNILALNKKVSGKDGSLGGQVFGSVTYTNSYSNLFALDTIIGNNAVTHTKISESTSKSKAFYSSNSFVFESSESDGIWGIDEGVTLPYLLFSPDKDIDNPLPNLEEDARKKVNELGDNPTQAELDLAKDKVDELSAGPVKEILLDLIKGKQEALDKANADKVLAKQIEEATKAVEQAEISKTVKDLTAASDLVNKLPDEAVKIDLTKRLDMVQQVLDENKRLENARNLVEQLGENPTQIAIDTARAAVSTLLDGKDKAELLIKVEGKQDALDLKVKEANIVVNAISTPPTQNEINLAQNKVNELPKGVIKTELQQVINEKKKQVGEIESQLMKAEEAVSKAEAFPTNYNVTIATKLVEALPESPNKTALQNRLQAIQDMFALEKAEAKVKQAENYERDPYLADAIALVDALTKSNSKQALKDRIQVILDKLQAIKEAEDATNNADGAYNPVDPKQTIEDAINTIQDSEAKKYFTNWNKTVGNAENYFSKTTVKNATKYLSELPSAYSSVASYENIIKELTERTENLKAEEVAVDVFAPVEKAVANYEKYKTSYYLKKAKESVETLSDSPEKTAFEKRLGVNESTGNGPTEEEKLVIQLANIEKAVANYEKFKTNFYQKKAVEAVSLMVDSPEKTAFQVRLNVVTE